MFLEKARAKFDQMEMAHVYSPGNSSKHILFMHLLLNTDTLKMFPMEFCDDWAIFYLDIAF